jgi:hypothetical protein
MRIYLPPEAREVEGITLQTAGQHSNGDHQQQPINALGVPSACPYTSTVYS